VFALYNIALRILNNLSNIISVFAFHVFSMSKISSNLSILRLISSSRLCICYTPDEKAWFEQVGIRKEDKEGLVVRSAHYHTLRESALSCCQKDSAQTAGK
jgi:hypothetical protein